MGAFVVGTSAVGGPHAIGGMIFVAPSSVGAFIVGRSSIGGPHALGGGILVLIEGWGLVT